MVSRRSPWARILGFLLVAAVLWLALAAVMTWRAVSVSPADRAGAMERIEAARARLGPEPPMVDVDSAFHVVRRAQPPPAEPAALDTLRVLAYRARSGHLVSVDVPFWFCRLKEPALAFVLRDTDLDLGRLGITVEDLQRHGPGRILDETSPDGDCLLVWTE